MSKTPSDWKPFQIPITDVDDTAPDEHEPYQPFTVTRTPWHQSVSVQIDEETAARIRKALNDAMTRVYNQKFIEGLDVNTERFRAFGAQLTQRTPWKQDPRTFFGHGYYAPEDSKIIIAGVYEGLLDKQVKIVVHLLSRRYRHRHVLARRKQRPTGNVKVIGVLS